MNVQEAVALLRRHNEWRRGAGGEMIEPRFLGLAIDLLCDHFYQAAEMVCLPPEIDPTSRVLDGIKHSPNFVSGWNRCRVAMLAATPAPVAQKVLDVITANELLDSFDAETEKVPVGDESETRGKSTYNWRLAIVREMRAMLSAAHAQVEK